MAYEEFEALLAKARQIQADFRLATRVNGKFRLATAAVLWQHRDYFGEEMIIAMQEMQDMRP